MAAELASEEASMKKPRKYREAQIMSRNAFISSTSRELICRRGSVFC